MSGLWLYLRLSQLEKLRHLQKIMMTTTSIEHDKIHIERKLSSGYLYMEEKGIVTKRLRAEICTPEGCSAMALKAALMMGEGARGQETREAERRASSGMVRARLARERATRERAVRARGGKLLSWEGRRNCPQGKRKAPTSGRYLK